MAAPIFSPAAQADIEDIYHYTLQNWGIEQAEKYIRALGASCHDLGYGSKRGLDVGNIRPGYKKLSCGSHFIFFKVTDTEKTEIIRILHQSMDVDRHL
ncbi:MAG: plasmid stabilization protein ParE [Robiginitomaculum sp.]|nr:MAG: plasmid stabilization protein ParE [Robiginitomaculum sp.]